MKRILAGLSIGLVLCFAGPLSVAAADAVPTVTGVTATADQDAQATGAGSAETTASEQAASEYVLPYPGMLPDNPLYFLKTLRDKIMELLISDPMKKAEFYILQSDKYLGMTTMLVEKGKNNLAAQTLTSSEENMKQAVTRLQSLRANGVTLPSDLTGKTRQSIDKHLEVLETVRGGISSASLSKAKSELSSLQKTVLAW